MRQRLYDFTRCLQCSPHSNWHLEKPESNPSDRPYSRYLQSLHAPKDWWDKSDFTCFLTRQTSDKGCLPFTKSFRKIPLESKWGTTFWFVAAQNVRLQRNIWKGSPVFPDGLFLSEMRVPFCWYPVSGLCGLLSANGKLDSLTIFISPEFCFPFAQTVNRPVCPCNFKKSRCLVILDTRKWRSFYLKDDKSEFWCSSYRRCPYSRQ